MGSGPKQQAPAPAPEPMPAPTPNALPTGPYGGLGYNMPPQPQTPSWATGAWSMGPVFNARGGSSWGSGQPAQAPAVASPQSPAITTLQQMLNGASQSWNPWAQNKIRNPMNGRAWQPPSAPQQSGFNPSPWG